MAKELPEVDSGGSVSPNVLKVMLALRKWGWVGVWTDIVFGVVSGAILLYAGFRDPARGASGSPATLPGMGFAWLGMLFVAAEVGWNYFYTRLARKLPTPNRPSRAQTVRQLKIGVIMPLVGMLLTLMGAFAIVGTLVFRASQQPQGGAILVPGTMGLLVNSVDLLIVQATFILILCHFVSLAISLWLLDRLPDRS